MANAVPVDENMKLTDCYYEKKDWRACKNEVSWLDVLGSCGVRAEMVPSDDYERGCVG